MRGQIGRKLERPDGSGLEWHGIKQGPVTNTLPLAYVTETVGKGKMKMNEFAGTASISTNDLTVTAECRPGADDNANIDEFFDQFRKTFKLKTSTFKLLDVLGIKFTENGGRQRYVSIKVREYMEMTGAKDYKWARKTIEADLDTLYRMDLAFKRGKCSLKNARVISEKDIDNGEISIIFSDKFADMLNGDNSFYMDYPDVLLKTDAQSDDFFVGRKIVEQVSMNRLQTKYNNDGSPLVVLRDPVAVGVGTLLEHSPFSPEYDPKKDRHLNGRVIESLEKTLDNLSEAGLFSWEWAGKKNGDKWQPVTDEDFKTYSSFKKLNVLIHPCESWPFRAEKLKAKQRRETNKYNARKRAEKKQADQKAEKELSEKSA